MSSGHSGSRSKRPPPEVIAGRYRVESRIGAGAMGAVLLATDLQTDRRVAVKRVDPGRFESPGAAERVLQGARAAASLSGEHVAAVLDHGVLEGGDLFFVTEYLEGTDLAIYVERRGPLRAREAVKYLLQVCEAIAAAHGAGVVHRDLKPQNVFLIIADSGAPAVKVMEFGTSAVACRAEGDGALLLSSAIRASLLSMAPEQMRSGAIVDERADLWSIGALGYLLVCGKGPFEAETELEICAKVMNDPPATIPSSLDLGGLREVLLRCLEKEPSHRYADVAELASALSACGGEGAREAAERVQRSLGARPPAELPEVPELFAAPEDAPASAPAPVPAPVSASVSVSAPAPASAPASAPARAPASAPNAVIDASPRWTRLRRPIEIAAAAAVLLGVLALWLFRGRVIDIGEDRDVASRGVAWTATRVIRLRTAAGAPEQSPGTTAPAPLAKRAPSASPVEAPANAEPRPASIEPPPGGWDYPPDTIYDEVERERRRAREEARRRAGQKH